MANKVEIRDQQNGVLIVSLVKILNAVASLGQNLGWYILHLQATGDLGEERSLGKLMDRINQAQEAYQIDWSELVVLANHLDQVIDGVFVGCKDQKPFKKSCEDDELEERCELVIDAFDSSYWRVYAKNSEIIKNLCGVFSEAKLL